MPSEAHEIVDRHGSQALHYLREQIEAAILAGDEVLAMDLDKLSIAVEALLDRDEEYFPVGVA
jgi:hypothetical protein